MSKETSLSKMDVTAYTTLLRSVKESLLRGQQRIEQEKVRTYWQTGQLIQIHILKNQHRAEYGAEVYQRLAKDLVIEKTLLYRCTRFFIAYPKEPIVATQPQFSWTHYVHLSKVPDVKERKKLEALTFKNDWSSQELSARIKGAGLGRQIKEMPEGAIPGTRTEGAGPQAIGSPITQISRQPLTVTRGQIFTYQIVKRKGLTGNTTSLVLDLGFSTYRDISGMGSGGTSPQSFAVSDIVESALKGGQPIIEVSNRTAKDLYTYKAIVERVVDADTLKVHIDLGFETWVRQTLRLRGIDAPELGTKEGEAAKVFVQSLLKESDEIVIRSSRSDKYDRYLADIFIPQENGASDIYLNNLLLSENYALRM